MQLLGIYMRRILGKNIFDTYSEGYNLRNTLKIELMAKEAPSNVEEFENYLFRKIH